MCVSMNLGHRNSAWKSWFGGGLDAGDDQQAGGGSPAPRQDTLGGRGPHPAEAPDPPHPPALAAHPADLPRGQPSRPPRGDGLVRGQRRRLHLRPGWQRRAARAGLPDRGRSQGAPRRGRGRPDARLRRLRLRRRLVAPETPGGRPARGDAARARSAIVRCRARGRASTVS